MYPDEDQITAEELDRILAEKATWVLDMLDIHEQGREDA